LLLDDHLELVRLFQYVLTELHRQNGELLVDLPERRLFLLVQIGTASDESSVGLFEQSMLLGCQAETLLLLMNGPNFLEQFLVEKNVVLMLGQEWRHLLGDSLHQLVRVGGVEVIEDGADGRQERTALL